MWIVCIDKNLSNAHVIIGVDLDDHILPHEPLTAGELDPLPRLARTLELPQENPAVKLVEALGEHGDALHTKHTAHDSMVVTLSVSPVVKVNILNKEGQFGYLRKSVQFWPVMSCTW